MNLARVIGTIVATQKDENLVGSRLLIIEPLDFITKKPISPPIIATDSVSACEGEYVFYVTAREAEIPYLSNKIQMVPTDATILGIVQSIDV